MAPRKQLECRVVVTHLPDKRIALGMYCPVTGRYEPLGTHGPAPDVVDSAVRGLKERIEREGHKVTFCERTQW